MYTCIVSNCFGNEYTHTLLVFTDLTIKKYANISLGITGFCSRKYTITTDHRLLNDDTVYASLIGIVCQSDSWCE